MISEDNKIRIYPTPCCAVAFLTSPDDVTKKEMEEVINFLKINAQSRNWLGTSSDEGGQRCAQIITTPHEKNLRKVVRECGFRVSEVFDRRNGYPKVGKLTMWTLTW